MSTHVDHVANLLERPERYDLLKKLNAESPSSVWGNNVTGVDLGQLMMETRKIPIKIAPRMRYIIRYTVKMLQVFMNNGSTRRHNLRLTLQGKFQAT
jgi:hypothetical protein